MATTAPPVHELDFLKFSANHLELNRKLTILGCTAPELGLYAQHVCIAWFRLGEEHLTEAKQIQAAGCIRAVFSRAYYAAYNASKGMRYMTQGFVSLKSDDHGKASSELPGDFPEVATWAGRLSLLYEHRLRADYDNWSSTQAEFTLKPAKAILEAEEFIAAARSYLNSKCSIGL